jgi:hypothetical protein
MNPQQPFSFYALCLFHPLAKVDLSFLLMNSILKTHVILNQAAFIYVLMCSPFFHLVWCMSFYDIVWFHMILIFLKVCGHIACGHIPLSISHLLTSL